MKRLKDSSDCKGGAAASIIRINAGGVIFATLYETLINSFPNCRLAKHFTDLDTVPRDPLDSSIYFVDMNPHHFSVILDILRHPRLLRIVPKDMSPELFEALLHDQELHPHDAEWDPRKESIQGAWLKQRSMDKELDKKVFALLLDLFKLEELIVSKEVSKTLYLPIGVYQLEDECGEADLPLYIAESMPELQALLDHVSDKTATLSLKKNLLHETPKEYVFQEVLYTSKTPCYAVTITIT